MACSLLGNIMQHVRMLQAARRSFQLGIQGAPTPSQPGEVVLARPGEGESAQPAFPGPAGLLLACFRWQLAACADGLWLRLHRVYACGLRRRAESQHPCSICSSRLAGRCAKHSVLAVSRPSSKRLRHLGSLNHRHWLRRPLAEAERMTHFGLIAPGWPEGRQRELTDERMTHLGLRRVVCKCWIDCATGLDTASCTKNGE